MSLIGIKYGSEYFVTLGDRPRLRSIQCHWPNEMVQVVSVLEQGPKKGEVSNKYESEKFEKVDI